ncbi:Saccharopine dehydrogenase [Blastocladiella emersonii ATCC 22665]|nr:Saccharopine dehydrogenase [Blastocladiella emersonii ATCC 22665]
MSSTTTTTTRPVHLWLRAETKPLEHRCALTPSVARTLLAEGFRITVESSRERIFDDAEFASAGCTLVGEGSWEQDAPADAIVLGLKELPASDTFPLHHTHIHFAHCYKNQAGWQSVLSRFARGKGTLLDLEFLHDEHGRRVAAFGFMAGFAGAALGLDVWAEPSAEGRTEFGAVEPFANEALLIAHIQSRLASATAAGRALPRVLVLGALGRCGRGAVALLRKAGLPDSHIAQWDMAETKRGGPFPEIATDYDVFVNCIYLATPIPPFLTPNEIALPGRKLAVLVDVSCDPTNPHNPIPVYTECTTFTRPTVVVPTREGAVPLHVVSIDHLPSLLPRESSEGFVNDLLPSLRSLRDVPTARVWAEAEQLFRDKVALLDQV